MINSLKGTLKKRNVDFSTFALVFFCANLFLTFDIYCKTQVTPETPLIKIGLLPFLRTDFVLIIFALAFFIGSLLTILIRKTNKLLLSLSLGMCGLVALFISFFNVDMMQTLSPTMRISHVIMTVSRVLAIFAGVSGIFVGVALTTILRVKNVYKSVFYGVISALIVSIFANAENLQTVIYCFSGIILLASSVTNDYYFNEFDYKIIQCSVKQNILNFLSFMSLVTIGGTLYGFAVENSIVSVSGYTVVLGVIMLFVVPLIKAKGNIIINSLGLFIGSVVSYVIVHYGSEVITFSGNRVIYVVYPVIWIAFMLLFVITRILCIKTNK